MTPADIAFLRDLEHAPAIETDELTEEDRTVLLWCLTAGERGRVLRELPTVGNPVKTLSRLLRARLLRFACWQNGATGSESPERETRAVYAEGGMRWQHVDDGTLCTGEDCCPSVVTGGRVVDASAVEITDTGRAALHKKAPPTGRVLGRQIHEATRSLTWERPAGLGPVEARIPNEEQWELFKLTQKHGWRVSAALVRRRLPDKVGRNNTIARLREALQTVGLTFGYVKGEKAYAVEEFLT